MSDAHTMGISVAKKMIMNVKNKSAVTYGNQRKKSMQSGCHQRFKLLGYRPKTGSAVPLNINFLSTSP